MRFLFDCWQIRVMELETELERERRRLGELRKQHYQMGGEAEGWEVAQVSWCCHLVVVFCHTKVFLSFLLQPLALRSLNKQPILLMDGWDCMKTFLCLGTVSWTCM